MCFGGRGTHRMIEWTYCLNWIKLIVFDCIFLPRSWAGGCLVRVIEKGTVGGCELTVFSTEVEKQVTWMIIEVFLNIFTCSAWKKPYRCLFERDSLTRTIWSKPFVFHTPIRVGFLSIPPCSLCMESALHFPLLLLLLLLLQSTCHESIHVIIFSQAVIRGTVIIRDHSYCEP